MWTRPRAAESVPRRLRMPLMALHAIAMVNAGVRATAATWERDSPDAYPARLDGCYCDLWTCCSPAGRRWPKGSPRRWCPGPQPRASAHDTNGYAIRRPGATTSEVNLAVVRGCPMPPNLLAYGITASDINDARNEPHGPSSLMTCADLPGWYAARPKSAEWVTRSFLPARGGRIWVAYRNRTWYECPPPRPPRTPR